jgi:cell cycle arrest protein BUB2
MTHLDAFLQHGPVHGHPVTGLDELRRVILLDGIPANSEGMVSDALRIGSYIHSLTSISLVRTPHLRLAHPVKRPASPDRNLPQSGQVERVARLRENP